MKKYIISISIILMLIFMSVISANAIARTPRIELDEYEITTTDINNVSVSGTCSICVGQLVGVYDSTGIILYNYSILPNTNSSSSFTIKVPARFLNEGKNTFKVKSLPANGIINGSNPKTLTITVKNTTVNKKNQIITASNLELKVGETKNINATTSSNLPLSYSTDNASIATIDTRGNVVGRRVGSSRITISQAGNDVYNSTSKVITVNVKDNSSSSTKQNQTISCIDSYQFADINKSINLNAKASSGLVVSYKSTNTKVVSVDKNGKLTSKNPGTVKIQVTQNGNSKYKPVTKNITVKVPNRNSYNEAMKPMEEAAIAQAKWMKNYSYSWDKWASGKNKYTIKKSKTCGSCVTYVACVCYRLGLLKDGSGNVVFCSANGKPGKKNYPSKYFTTYYYKGGKSVKWLKKNNKLKKGDILMYAFGSNKAGGHGNHNYIFAGSYSGNKVKAWSNSFAASFKRTKNGKLEKNGSKITGVVRPKTFNIDTSCVNGTITQSRLVLAAQQVVVEWKANSGKKVSKILVDGKDKTSTYKNKGSIIFKNLDSTHSVEVIFN